MEERNFWEIAGFGRRTEIWRLNGAAETMGNDFFQFRSTGHPSVTATIITTTGICNSLIHWLHCECTFWLWISSNMLIVENVSFFCFSISSKIIISRHAMIHSESNAREKRTNSFSFPHCISGSFGGSMAHTTHHASNALPNIMCSFILWCCVVDVVKLLVRSYKF